MERDKKAFTLLLGPFPALQLHSAFQNKEKLGWKVIRAGHKYSRWVCVPCCQGHPGTRHLLVQKYSCNLPELQLSVMPSLAGRALADVQQLNGLCSLEQPPKQPKGKEISLQHQGAVGMAAEPSLGCWRGSGSSSDPTALHPTPLDGVPCSFQGKAVSAFQPHLLSGRKNVVKMPYPDECVLSFCKLNKFQQDGTNPEHKRYFRITAFLVCEGPQMLPLHPQMLLVQAVKHPDLCFTLLIASGLRGLSQFKVRKGFNASKEYLGETLKVLATALSKNVIFIN